MTASDPLTRWTRLLAGAAVIALAASFTFINVDRTLAGQFAIARNLTNSLSTAVLYPPTGLSASRSGSTDVLTWSAASPMNGNGYAITGVNNGASSTCPATAASYTTYVGSTAGTTFTDSGGLAGGAAGTYVCYLVRTGYSAAGAPPWAAVPGWTSTTLVTTALQIPGSVPVPALVQQRTAADGTGTAQTLAPTWPSATTAGNLLVAAIGLQDTTVNVTMPAGWQAGPAAIGTKATRLYYYANAPAFAAGAAVSVNLDSNTPWAVLISEWSKVVAVAPLDASGTATGSGTSASVSSSAATTQSGELAVAAVFNGNATDVHTFTPGAGWLDVANTGSTGGATLDVIYRVLPLAGIATATETWTVADAWAAAIATFKHA